MENHILSEQIRQARKLVVARCKEIGAGFKSAAVIITQPDDQSSLKAIMADIGLMSKIATGLSDNAISADIQRSGSAEPSVHAAEILQGIIRSYVTLLDDQKPAAELFEIAKAEGGNIGGVDKSGRVMDEAEFLKKQAVSLPVIEAFQGGFLELSNELRSNAMRPKMAEAIKKGFISGYMTSLQPKGGATT